MDVDCGVGAVCAASGVDMVNSRVDVKRRVRGRVRVFFTVIFFLNI